MILILEKYIARTIFLATGLSALIITGVMLLVNLLAEMKNIGEGDYGFSQALIFVLMRMPAEVYQFTPMLILLGCIIGLSILSSSRELMIMRASGFSVRQIMKSVFISAVGLLLVLCVLGEYFAPKMSYTAEIHKEYAKNSGQAVMTTAGVWFHVDNNFIHVENVVNRDKLENVTRYQFDDQHRLQVAYFAKSVTRENNQWIMHDVEQTNFYPNRTKSESLQQSPWNLEFNTNLLGTGVVEASEMSLTRLKRYIHFLEQNGLQANGYKYEWWQRLFLPFAALVMVFLALPFVLGTFNTSSLGLRLLIGVIVGFAFFILKACLGQLSIVFQIPPMLAALIPLLMFGLLATFLSRRLIKQ